MNDKLARRHQLLQQIVSAFSDVKLNGGIGAEQSYALDNVYESQEAEECALTNAIAKDRQETGWEQVLNRQYSYGAIFRDHLSLFCFLDPIGFRFFLPACMTWLLNNWESKPAMLEFFIYALSPSFEEEEIDEYEDEDDYEADLAFFARVKERLLEKYALLNDFQRNTIYEFLLFVVDFAEKSDAETAKSALQQYWNEFC